MYLPGYFTVLMTNFPIRVYIYSLSLSRGSLGTFWYETTISDVTITAREDVSVKLLAFSRFPFPTVFWLSFILNLFLIMSLFRLFWV